MPSYLADRDGRIRWLNEEALSTFGDARGRLLSSLAAPDHAQRSREQLARKVVGGAGRTDFQIDAITEGSFDEWPDLLRQSKPLAP